MSVHIKYPSIITANLTIVTGIVGTGRTWHIIDAACTRAAQGERVLMISGELDRAGFLKRAAELEYPESVLDEIVYVQYESNNVGPSLEQYLDDLVMNNNATVVVLDVFQDKFSILKHLHDKIPLVMGVHL